MKIAGFTIIKNAVQNDYPVVESITSILPIVDDMIVSVGDCNDGTEELVRGINSSKIRIVHSVWDPSLKMGGKVLAVETDKAKQHIRPEYDWAFYIQADEVLHEQYYEAIRAAAEQYKDRQDVEGLLFNYMHFYGTYDYIGDSRKWYNKEVRIIRNDPRIKAYRDAQGFRKDGEKLQVKMANACMYHYGWVKDPRLMMNKQKAFLEFWEQKKSWKDFVQQTSAFDYNDFDSVDIFRGTHPAVMKERIMKKNWQVTLDSRQKKFSLKEKLLYWFEKKTGQRLFAYKNYRLIP
ncbi:MAG TPA: hypothetical protein VM012_10040 [Flavitalea sp.]|nr:hypothetical protein [Flavitalea sp.]